MVANIRSCERNGNDNLNKILLLFVIPCLVCIYSFSFLNSISSSMCTNMFDLKIIIACLLLTSLIHSDLSCSCILYVTCETYFDQYNKLATKLHISIVSDEAEFDIFDPVQLFLWAPLDLHSCFSFFHALRLSIPSF